MLNLKKLKAYRNEFGLTRMALAEKIGISSAHYSQIERGDAGISMETFDALLKALDVSVIDLWMDADGNAVTLPSEVVIEKNDGVSKITYALPLTEETYRFLADEINVDHFEPRLKTVINAWNSLSEEEKDRIVCLSEKRNDKSSLEQS